MMKENENIKALENLHNKILNDASFLAKVNHGELSALFHIGRILEFQDAEIERLEEELANPVVSYTHIYAEDVVKVGFDTKRAIVKATRAEAIKEFADMFKKKYDKPLFYLGSYGQFAREVDNLVKEMLGKEDESNV